MSSTSDELSVSHRFPLGERDLLYEQGERHPAPNDIGTSGRSRSSARDVDLYRRDHRLEKGSRGPIIANLYSRRSFLRCEWHC